MTCHGASKVSHAVHAAPADTGGLDEHYVAVPARVLEDLCQRASDAADALGLDDPRHDPLVRALRGAVGEVRCHSQAPV